MSKIRLEVEPKFFEQSESQATGIIFFDFGKYQFPEVGWNDFVLVILNWWLIALQNIVSGKSDKEEFRFMEGPLYLVLNKIDRDRIVIECFDEASGENAEYSEEYHISDIIEAVISSAKKIEKFALKQGYENNDLREIRESLADLEALVS